MTIEELRAIITDVKSKTTILRETTQDLHSFVEEVDQIVNGIAGSSINPDQLVAVYGPIYIEKLTAVEVATDVLH